MKRGLKEPTKGVSKKVNEVKDVSKKVVKKTKAAPKVPKIVKKTKAAPKVLANKLKKFKNVGGVYSSHSKFLVPYHLPTRLDMNNINYKQFIPSRRAESRGSMSNASSSSSGKISAESNPITEEELTKRRQQIIDHIKNLDKEDEELDRKEGRFKKIYRGFLDKIGLEQGDEFYFPVRKIR